MSRHPIQSHTPASEAAAGLLRGSYKALETALDRARSIRATPRTIHRLRIASRRAEATSGVFQSLLQHKRAAALRGECRRVRRAAARAREADVLGDVLLAHAEDYPDATAFLLRLMVHRRESAYKRLDKSITKKRTGRVRKRRKHVIQRISDDGMAFSEFALRSVRDALHEARAAITSDLTVFDNLHRVRIVCKHLRYTIETVAPCAITDPDPLLARLAAIQEHLGEVNDLCDLIEFIERALESAAPPARLLSPIAELLAELDCERKHDARAFRKWLTRADAITLFDEIARAFVCEGVCHARRERSEDPVA